MGWLDDVLAQLQGGGAPAASLPPASPFPDSPPAQLEGQALWDKIAADEAAANAAADRRNAAGMMTRQTEPYSPFGVPGAGSAGVRLAMGDSPPGTGIPVPAAPASPDGSPFGTPGQQFAPMSIGLPPSMQTAKTMTAPPPGPAGAPGAAVGEGAEQLGGVDIGAQRRGGAAAAGPAAAPMGVPPAMMLGAPQKGFADRLADLGPGLVALGQGLSGQGWEGSRELAKNNQALALQAQQGNATARLLASKGASAAEIQAAIAGGPDTLKALLGQYMTKDKYSVVQTSEDKYGRKTYKLFNSADGTTKEIPADSASDAKSTAENQDMEGVTGAARLTALEASDPAYARKVQAAVNGDISLPTGKAAQTPAGRKFIEDVLGVDGTVSEADFKIRQQVRKNYTSGKDFQVTKSINTVVDHGAQLEKAIEKLGNNNYLSAITNPIRDAILSQTDPEYIKAKQGFKTNAENFAREMDFALSGGRPTVSGAAHQREAFDALAAQVGQKEALRKSIELLEARLREHQRGYEEALPPGTKQGIVPHLEPKTESFIKRILGSDAPPAAKAPKPGNYVYRNGVLVPE
jgi:hypothetical protein